MTDSRRPDETRLPSLDPGRTLISFSVFVSFKEAAMARSITPEAEQAAAAAGALDRGKAVVLPRSKKAEPVELPPSVVRVLAEVLDHASRGEHVRVVAANDEITTGEAAELLGVSASVPRRPRGPWRDPVRARWAADGGCASTTCCCIARSARLAEWKPCGSSLQRHRNSDCIERLPAGRRARRQRPLPGTSA